MARVFAFDRHTVRWTPKQSESLTEWSFPAGEVREVPDELAEWVTGVHPQKLKLLGENEAAPSLRGAAYADTSMGESPANRMMSQDAELCGQPTKTGALCQMARPCRWHK